MMSQTLLPLAFGAAATVATLAGGVLTLRFAGRMTLVVALAAGVVLGVAFLDLLPEALALAPGAGAARILLTATAAGFGGYMILDRALGRAGAAAPDWRTHLAPASLTVHSFLDGMGVGLAFQVSPAVGWSVAIAVLTHDVADGINTVSLSLAASRVAVARRWLLVNGLAPLVGTAAGMVVRVPPSLLAPLLAGFAGVFLFIGACELVPRSFARDPRLRTTVATVAGIVLMALATHYAH